MTADGWKCFLSAREFTPKAIYNYSIVLPFGVEGVDNYLQFLSSTTIREYKYHERLSTQNWYGPSMHSVMFVSVEEHLHDT